MKKFVVAAFCALSILGFSESPLSRIPKYKDYTQDESVSVQDYFDSMMQAYQNKNYRKAIGEATAILEAFPGSPFAADAAYYKGASYYYWGNLQKANDALSFYLNQFDNLNHFYDAIQLKFCIAKDFSSGVRKHLLGAKTLPRWVAAKEDALEIYDEVISALPRDEICATSLFNKASLLEEYEEYKESIDVYQTLIRRFPKHHLSATAFLNISQVFLEQASKLFPDPDYIDLAQLNIQKFSAAFPGDERIAQAKQNLQKMKSIFAKELYEMAAYYKKKKKIEAAQIYYKSILTYYPDTKIAEKVAKMIDEGSQS